jgi:transcriptional regulator with XRE-family HTH domain
MIGEQIAHYREQIGLKQVELAAEIGVKRAALSHYELNRREPDIKTLIKLSDRFGVTVDRLVRGGATNEC